MIIKALYAVIQKSCGNRVPKDKPPRQNNQEEACEIDSGFPDVVFYMLIIYFQGSII